MKWNSKLNLVIFVSTVTILTSCTDRSGMDVKGLLSDGEIRGELVVVDKNNSIAKVKALQMGPDLASKLEFTPSKEFDFMVQPGDISLLKENRIFRGKLQETYSASQGKTHLLYYIWPDDVGERIRLNNVNRLLRRDTLSMGQDVIRTVGDQVPPFALYDQDGKVLTSEFFDGSTTVMNFIFTRCSIAEMCPASTLKMKKLQHLSEKTKVPHVQFLSISLDPEFDSPGVMKTYARGYDLKEDNFKLGTAKKTVIDDLTRQLGISRKKEDGLPLDHTMRTMIINSKRQIVYQVPGKSWSVKDFLSRLQPIKG